VGFVHGHERAPKALHEGTEAWKGQPLGSDVDELAGAAGDQAHASPHLAGVDGGREVGRRDAAGVERLDLVLHERDQRRDDQRGAVEERGRKLVDEALAAAGRRDEEQAA